MENKKVRYMNLILKAKVSPIRRGELLEESKKCSHGYMRVLIDFMEKNEGLDIVECKLELKRRKEASK